MKTNVKPQFTPDDLYIIPFSQYRTFNPEDGTPIYNPVERNTSPTGVDILNAYARAIISGTFNSNHHFCKAQGIEAREFSALCRILLGMDTRELHHHLLFRYADELLRYTDLSIEEVARRCGSRNANILNRRIQKRYHCSAGKRRRMIRQKRDIGKYMI